MEATYWLKQTAEAPMFPDLLWDKPENRQTAGKLLVVGGNTHGFAVPAQAYQEALKAGIGSVKVLLPDSLKKIVGPALEVAEFASSNVSGSFSQKALADLIDHSSWADATLLAGELGRNSETTIVLEKFLQKTTGLVVVTRDVIDYFNRSPLVLLDRPNTLCVVSVGQLQKLCNSAHFSKAIMHGMDLLQLVDALHQLTTQHAAAVITRHLNSFCVATKGKVSTTPIKAAEKFWRTEAASYASVWSLQNPTKPFEALTTSLYQLSTLKDRLKSNGYKS